MHKTIVALRARRRPQQPLDAALIARGGHRFAIDLPADDRCTNAWDAGLRELPSGKWSPIVARLRCCTNSARRRFRASTCVARARVRGVGSRSRRLRRQPVDRREADLLRREAAGHHRRRVRRALIARTSTSRASTIQACASTNRMSSTASRAIPRPRVGGISEFWFRSVHDLINRYYAFADSSAITHADSANFLDPATTTWMLVQEYWINR